MKFPYPFICSVIWCGIYIERVFNKKLLINFTKNYKDMTSNLELNVKFRKSITIKITFSCKTYSNNTALHLEKKEHFDLLFLELICADLQNKT